MSKSKKNIWVFHHYATPSNMSGLTRPYDFGKKLIKNGYSYRVFSSSYLHYSGEQIINDKSLYIEDNSLDVPFIFVKTNRYFNNGFFRIKNMFLYSYNLYKVSKKLSKKYGRPDIIISSSPHPFSLIIGRKLSKKFRSKSIFEVRDLWPESIIEFSNLKKKSLVSKLLYFGEKWLYKNCDKLIFTMEGGKEYIKDKSWNINLDKVHHINNGVDIESFEKNKLKFNFEDNDLDNKNIFKVIYMGTIRKVNELDKLIDIAAQTNKNDIKYIVFGEGDQEKRLIDRCTKENITNIVFKGSVEKKFVPSILSKSDLNFFVLSEKDIYRYGISLNKLFDYLASKKPVFSTSKPEYSIIDKYKAGISLEKYSVEEAVKTILYFKDIKENSKEEYDIYCENAYNLALKYDFEKLSEKLINIIEEL